jgi:hypothetical protein
MKTCTKCKIEKDLSEFTKDKNSKDKLSYWCKNCFNHNNKNYRKNNKDKLSELNKNYRELHQEDFKCYKKNWYLKNRIRLNIKSSKYYQNNKKHLLKLNQLWRKENHYSSMKNHNQYLKVRRKDDSLFRLLCNLRSRLTTAIKKSIKSASTKELLGCSIDYVRKHLESQFTDDMSWDNYGRKKKTRCWEIDHIKPCASFDMSKESEQRQCFHYTNLQPLWAVDNWKKNDKY